MEHTLLPDEAVLQTIAVNSPYRRTLIASHLRFIEWPQLHGDANKYWASLGPRFHGGPMVLNESLTTHKVRLPKAYACPACAHPTCAHRVRSGLSHIGHVRA